MDCNAHRDLTGRPLQLAVIFLEFGGTAGLVTLEDVVEEVLGELRDPYDQEEAEIVQLGPQEFLADAALALDDLGERLGCTFPEERDYETLGGFLFDCFDEIPTVGQETTFNSWRFTVRELEGNRIAKVLIQSGAQAAENHAL